MGSQDVLPLNLMALPRGEGCDTRIPSSKKRRRSRHLNPEPNESKVKRSCEEMRIHFFTAPFYYLRLNVTGTCELQVIATPFCLAGTNCQP